MTDRSRLPLRLAPLLALLLLGAVVAPATWAQDQDGGADGMGEGTDLRSSYDEVLDEEAALEEAVDLAATRRARLLVDIATVQRELDATRAKLDEATRLLQAAVRKRDVARAALRAAQRRLTRATEQLHAQAVSSYVTGGTDNEMLAVLISSAGRRLRHRAHPVLRDRGRRPPGRGHRRVQRGSPGAEPTGRPGRVGRTGGHRRPRRARRGGGRPGGDADAPHGAGGQGGRGGALPGARAPAAPRPQDRDRGAGRRPREGVRQHRDPPRGAPGEAEGLQGREHRVPAAARGHRPRLRLRHAGAPDPALRAPPRRRGSRARRAARRSWPPPRARWSSPSRGVATATAW